MSEARPPVKTCVCWPVFARRPGHVLPVVLCLWLAACAVPPADTPGGPEIIDARAGETSREQKKESGLYIPPRSIDDAAVAAIDQLLLTATEAMEHGQLDKASAMIERAIRLSPKDARSYFSLAQVRYRQGQYEQVRSLVDKASTLARDDRQLQQSIMEFAQRIALHP